jgi:hypothetical protein
MSHDQNRRLLGKTVLALSVHKGVRPIDHAPSVRWVAAASSIDRIPDEIYDHSTTASS